MSVFFFKQKTAYEMRISDWSSDVCSSDLPDLPEEAARAAARARRPAVRELDARRLDHPEPLLSLLEAALPARGGAPARALAQLARRGLRVGARYRAAPCRGNRARAGARPRQRRRRQSEDQRRLVGLASVKDGAGIPLALRPSGGRSAGRIPKGLRPHRAHPAGTPSVEIGRAHV